MDDGGLSASSAEFSADNTGSLLRAILTWLVPALTAHHIDVIHHLARKLAHFTEYAILGALWFRGVTRSGLARPAATWLALAISVLCAIVDETHQSFLPSRTGAVQDVLLDSAGAFAAIVPLAWAGGVRPTRSRASCCGPPRSGGWRRSRWTSRPAPAGACCG